MKTTTPPLILMVDDNPHNLQLLGTLLEGTYQTAIVRDGRKALEFVKKRLPDVILLDIMMPEIDGFEVCARLKADPTTSAIPIIFLTAKTETADILKGFQLGAVDYVTKPFQKEELLARINTHLALQAAKRALEDANASKDKFFSIIAHDLRNPFNSLLGLSELLLQHFDDYERAQIKKYLQDMQTSAKTVYALVENLLTWSRLQRGIMDFQPHYLNLQDVIDQNLELLRPLAAQKQITLTNPLPAKAIVYADADMVEAVLRNLLSNALKFTKPGGLVEVSTLQRAQHVEVAVVDTGVGIAAPYLSQLFDLHAQYRRRGTANEQGTGLGLILCQEFIAQHGGKIWAESEIDQGTTFRFTLPRQP